MPVVFLTKRIEFAAAHRYVRREWDEARNRAVFGPCYNPPAHGHNYLLEVTVCGDVDLQTGMVINLFDLKHVLLTVIEEFDHKNFNLDMPYFKESVPTSENVARVLWTRLQSQRDIGRLHAIRLWEDEDLCADLTAAGGLDVASITRRYSFPTVQNGHQTREWDCYVTVHGSIDPVTGMVTDIAALDRLAEDRVIRHDYQDLLKTSDDAVAGGRLIERIWHALAGRISPGRLTHVRLVQSRDLSFEYTG